MGQGRGDVSCQRQWPVTMASAHRMRLQAHTLHPEGLGAAIIVLYPALQGWHLHQRQIGTMHCCSELDSLPMGAIDVHMSIGSRLSTVSFAVQTLAATRRPCKKCLL